MISQNTFIEIAMTNKNFNGARKILNSNATDFSIYSCNNEIIEKIIQLQMGNKTVELNELINLIKKSNLVGRDINDIMFESQNTNKEQNAFESFFKSFDDVTTKERLFVIIGETGVGKSYMIEKRYPSIPQYACNKALDPYSLCYYLADIDGFGLKPNETPFLKALRNGGKVFLDEMNELPHDTLMFIQGITDEKKSVVVGNENITIHPDFKIIASLNPPSETDERTPLGDAILGRAVGLVVELTDDMIAKRLNISTRAIQSIRKLFNFIISSGFTDVRELNYRDFAKFAKYDFEQQVKFKVCMGDVENIRGFSRISSTQEYNDIIKQCKKELNK